MTLEITYHEGFCASCQSKRMLSNKHSLALSVIS